MKSESSGIKAVFDAVETPENENSQPTKSLSQTQPEVKEQKQEYIKVTVYIRPDQLASLEEFQVMERKKTGKRPSKMILVREALDQWIEKNYNL
ncbi:MAG: hypothetical protein FD167_2378 [bacterium]|nr:MAG: hypothetical protein FD167_2378 [bacterium]